jgi:hypothetical protein
LYSVLVIYLGPGSMYFHASLKKWGGWLDNLSMNLFMSFVLVYDIVRLLMGNGTLNILVFLVIYLIINVIIGYLTWLKDGNGNRIFRVLLGITLASDFIVSFIPSLIPSLYSSPIHREPRWLVVSVSLLLVSYIVWSLSDTGKRLCREGNIFGWFSPKSWVQGHAMWHILNALAAGTLFLYLSTEILS